MSTYKLKMDLWARLWRHWMHPSLRIKRYFSPQVLRQLTDQISLSEQRHTGQVRFVIESKISTVSLLQGVTARQRGEYWFAHLGVWDTMYNSGVLVYVLFADRAVEIIADRGINACVPIGEWQRICNKITQAFEQRNYLEGLKSGLDELTDLLVFYFPHKDVATNELVDDVILR